jgi:hypothetical protein
MQRKPSLRTKPDVWRQIVSTILPLVALAGLAACGGGGNPQQNISTGGGVGTTGPDCAQPTPVTTASGNVANGVGTTVPSNYMDLHVGSSDLVSGVTVPFGGLRLWDTSTGWAQVNTSLNNYDWSNLDAFVSATQAKGVDILYNLARTPNWASSNPNDSSCSYDTSGQGGGGQCDPPLDLNSDGSGTDQDWITWVSAVATRYKGQIKYYEIWNEWNISLFWTGTPAQLGRMEQDARCIVEGPPSGFSCNSNSSIPQLAIDPSARIVTPSPVGAATDLNQVGNDLTTYFQTSVPGGANGGTFADIIGFHGYVSTKSSADQCPNPENVTTVVNDLNSAVQGSPTQGKVNGVNKPWFDTEDSWGKAPDEGFEDPDRQAAFLAREFLLQWSLGVQRLYWYRWDATQTYGGALWTSSTGPTEAASAWDEVNKWMVGNTLSSACTPNTGGSAPVWSCAFTNGSWKGLAVWDASQDCLNGTCGTSSFSVPAGYTQYLDLAGNETSSAAGSTIQIGAKPVLLESGNLP